MQVKLLKEGKEIPPELEEQMREGKMKEDKGKEEVEGLSAELQTLRDKVNVIHSLLGGGCLLDHYLSHGMSLLMHTKK